jgi:hypothetical protein
VREEKKGQGLLVSFLYHLELGGGETICHHLAPLTYRLGGGTLESREGAVPDSPYLACLKRKKLKNCYN